MRACMRILLQYYSYTVVYKYYVVSLRIYARVRAARSCMHMSESTEPARASYRYIYTYCRYIGARPRT